jgi:hypothetical protein
MEDHDDLLLDGSPTLCHNSIGVKRPSAGPRNGVSTPDGYGKSGRLKVFVRNTAICPRVFATVGQ